VADPGLCQGGRVRFRQGHRNTEGVDGWVVLGKDIETPKASRGGTPTPKEKMKFLSLKCSCSIKCLKCIYLVP